MAAKLTYEQLEQQLRALQKKWDDAGDIEYAHILNTSIDGFWMLDSQGRLLKTNPAAARMLGYRQRELTGMSINDIDAEESPDQTRQRLARLAESGYDRFETRHRRKDGGLIDVEISTRYLPEKNGRLVVFIRDISQRKQAEKKLLQQQRSITLNNRIANVFLTAEAPTIFADVLDIILDEMDSRFGYFGYLDDKENLVCPSMTREIWEKCRIPEKNFIFPKNSWGGRWGQSLLEKKTILANQGLCLPQGHLSLENALMVPVLHGSSLIGQFAVANKTGGYTENDQRLLELAAFQTAPILNAHLQAERQHQRREQLESQLRQAQKMESIGTLAGGIAHDFNNILSPVIGFTELSLERVVENTRLHRNLSEVLKGGLRAKELVKQILTMSRREEQEKMPVAVTPLIKDALKMLRATIPASIEFKEDISSRDLIVNADPTQLHQIIMNLATNAVQAMRDQSGLLEVSVQPVQFDQDISRTCPDIRAGHYARLAVSDTGTGIPEKDREKIFEPYFTTKKKEDGTGLGLAVVHGIVKSHHGHINFYSDPGQGTTFHVYLPLAESGSAIRPSRAVTPLPTGTETILLVDDELPIAEMIYQCLERRGYKVIIRTRSIEALEAFRFSPRRFDLVITDLTMPQMTGDKLARAIKAIRPDVPIILCTGFSEKIRQLDDQNLPIDSFLMKPVDQISLTRTIRQLIDKTETPDIL